MPWRLVFYAPVLAGLAMSLSWGSSVPAPTPTPTGLLTRTPVVVPHTIPPPPGFVTSSPQPTLVPLTDGQSRQIEAIIRADPTIADIVGDISYTVSDLGPWYAATVPATGEDLIGGVDSVLLSRSIPHIEHSQVVDGAPLGSVCVGLVLGSSLLRAKVTSINVADDYRYSQTVTYPSSDPTPQFSLGVSSDVQDIFSGDARLNAILSGRSYQGPLAVTYSFASPHLHYAAETFSFDQSQDIEADWPIAVNGDAFTGQYQTDTIHFVATGVRSISATVDLDSGQLVSIQPSQHSPGD